MTHQVLSRKWRPQNFDQMIGQSIIVRSLRNAILNDKLGHAYLMAGTRGIGKTSLARIFAMALRCSQRDPRGNPCGSCKFCKDVRSQHSMDVLEIDGASHNSVEDMRELIHNIQYLPTSSKYRISIIDEVHMLSINAFNSLLKTLEDPPAHALFILATTKPEKLPETILSRCQRFDFKNANIHDLVAHISFVAKREGVTFDSDDLILKICRQGRGSVRDTLSLFDQVLLYAENSQITETDLVASLGLVKTESIRKIVNSLLQGDLESCSHEYRSFFEENITLENVAIAILDLIFFILEQEHNREKLYRENIVERGVLDYLKKAELYFIYDSLLQDFQMALKSLLPDQAMEIALRKICLRGEFFEEFQAVPVLHVKGFLRYFLEKFPKFYKIKILGNIDFKLEKIDVEFTAEGSHLQELKDILPDTLSEYSHRSVECFHLTGVDRDEIYKREREKVICEDPLFEEVSKIFDAKIDRVILKK